MPGTDRCRYIGLTYIQIWTDFNTTWRQNFSTKFRDILQISVRLEIHSAISKSEKFQYNMTNSVMYQIRSIIPNLIELGETLGVCCIRKRNSGENIYKSYICIWTDFNIVCQINMKLNSFTYTRFHWNHSKIPCLVSDFNKMW